MVSGHLRDKSSRAGADTTYTRGMVGPFLLHRFLIWGALGMLGEVIYTAIYDLIKKKDLTLTGKTYLWMFPIYGLIAVLYEPAFEQIRDLHWVLRAVIWSIGFTAIEWLTGLLLHRSIGKCPWDYQRAGAKLALGPYIRADYFPLWAAIGLLLESLTVTVRNILPLVF
jgi:uncharacterized membrane protein